ncbi:MAG: STAS domain-containing protein [Anaerolineales bacterium]|nr:STAS domain-containing protein [Anaerolineales bacterium]
MAKTQPFSAQVRQTGKAVTIDLHGEVDSFASNRLHEAYSEVEQFDPPVILLNFSDVSYINSTGIALIVSLLAQARKMHRKVYVYGLTDHYITIFQITRLADFMSIYPNEDSALADAAALG